MSEKENKISQGGEESADTSVLDGALFAKMASGGAAELRANADEVNNLNVFPVPDGDTGDNMRMTIENGVAALSNLQSNDLEMVMSTLSRGMLLGARGNSGVILSQFFSGMAKGFENRKRADAATIGAALQLGVKKAYASVLTPTEGTILTVARESVEYAVSRLTEESTVNSLFADLAGEMTASLQRTPELLAALKEAKVVDSGGAGLLYIIKGFNRVLRGEDISTLIEEPAAQASAVQTSTFDENSEMVFGYCTEFLLQLQHRKTNIAAFDVSTVTDYLRTIGDSIVAFKDGSIVKVHVHTMTPEKALGFCRQFGEFLTVKIENMSVQHNETIPEEQTAAEEPLPEKKYASVAVCSGEGIRSTFLELGVDQVISGGQTNNPSTQDFLDAFARIRAEHIFVFPNNGNIIMAARQAAEEYTAACVHVVETKSLGSGYVGIAAIDPEAASAEEILARVNEAMQTVATGSVSLAVRDADLGGKHITNGDYIGFVGKDVVAVAADREEAARALAGHILSDPDAFLLTVFYGKDVSPEVAEAMEAYCREQYPEVEIYFINGGQEIYPYIMTAEVCG